MSGFLKRARSKEKDDEDGAEEVLLKDLSRISILIYHFTVDTVKFIIASLKLWLVWPCLLALRFVLEALRWVTKESLKIAGPLISFVIGAIDEVVNLIIKGLNDILSVVNDISFGSLDISIDKIDLSKKVQVVTDACDVFETCDAIDTMSWEVFHMLKLKTHDLCSVVRYTYPVDFMYDTLEWLFGWAILDPKPVGQPGCTVPKYYTFCFVANSYEFVDFVLLVLFLYVLISSYWKTITYFLFHIALPFVAFVLKYMHTALKRIWAYLFAKPTQQLAIQDKEARD